MMWLPRGRFSRTEQISRQPLPSKRTRAKIACDLQQLRDDHQLWRSPNESSFSQHSAMLVSGRNQGANQVGTVADLMHNKTCNENAGSCTS